MSFAFARGLMAHLCAFALFFQGLELFQMLRSPLVLSVWNRRTVGREIRYAFPLPGVEWLAGDQSLRILSQVEMGLAACAFLRPSAILFFLLLVVHLLICVRFRGSLNGGSDAMTAVVLTGLYVSFLFKGESFARFGLIWVAVHLLLSYARSGFAKARSLDWRSGLALPAFLGSSFFADVRARSGLVAHRAFGWAVVVFELVLVLSPVLPVYLMFALAACFHFAIYFSLGLNRFFWIWMAAWPSLFYLSGLISNH